MCCARSSTRSDSPITTESTASSNTSGKRDMCTPFRAGSRSTQQEISAATSFSCSRWRRRIALLTPRTPARDRPILISGTEACRSGVRSFASVMPSAQDTSFARLVSLACHDLRTPLATVYGFARTLMRDDGLGDPAARYVGMIESASQQLGELLDELGLAARIELGRYEPSLKQTDTAELGRSAAAQLGEDRAGVTGPGGTVLVDVEATER